MKLKAIALVVVLAACSASIAAADDGSVVYSSTEGAVSAVSPTSITVGSLTCSVTSASPSVTAAHVGDHASIQCSSGVLSRLVLAVVTTSSEGTISALSPTSITVGSLTCTTGSGSPSVTGFLVGDRVGIACGNGALARITKLHVYGSADGTVSAVSSTSITVGALTCSIGTDPSASGVLVGDRVSIYCIDGTLTKLEKKNPAPVYTAADGTLSALSTTSITVGTLTCTIGSSSPNSSNFHVGDHVRMYCSNGTLFALIRLDGPSNQTTATDPISALSTTSITVGRLTCTIGSGSPSLAGFALGDRVGISCPSGALATITHLDPLPGSTTKGAITALSSTSITVAPLTCSIGSSSPSVTAFHVGDYVGIGCTAGVLVKIAKTEDDDEGSSPHPTATASEGTISALSSTSITVGTLTCTIGSSSPSVTTFHVGDRAGIGCKDGALTRIAKLPALASGAITALSSTSITVGTLTCAIGLGSPSVAGLQVDDQAQIACLDGALTKIVKLHDYASSIGLISALSSTSITVAGLTCSIGSASPGLSDYALGDRVGIECLDKVLARIGKPVYLVKKRLSKLRAKKNLFKKATVRQ